MKRHVAGPFVTILLIASAAACGSTLRPPRTAAATVEEFTVVVRARHHHDSSWFTEGLVIDDRGRMFESIGGYDSSAVLEVDPSSGAAMMTRHLDPELFGEGLTERHGELVQLTWKVGKALRWVSDSLTPLPGFRYDGEGWGLAYDPAHDRFIQSDGSSQLTFRFGSTFAKAGAVEVTMAGQPVDQLNELEVVDGDVLANVWHSDRIMRIDPASGRVNAVIDAAGLWDDPERTEEMVLNGIAHRPGDPADRLILTGKNWPWRYDVDLVAK